ncbi:hypothetical protein IJJ08_00180 [bacterium]|nr:hypothetical protein [bacterium]
MQQKIMAKLHQGAKIGLCTLMVSLLVGSVYLFLPAHVRADINPSNLFTVNRTELRNTIRANGGQLGWWGLIAREEAQTWRRFPGFRMVADYRTDKYLLSCYTKRWDAHLYETDCPGNNKQGSCPNTETQKFLSGVDYFTYLCEGPCKMYEQITGRSCNEIVDQEADTFPIEYSEADYIGWPPNGYYGGNEVNTYKPITFIPGNPDLLHILQGGIDGLNELLPYTRVGQEFYLGKVKPLNLASIDTQINTLRTELRDLVCQAKQHADSANASVTGNQEAMNYACNAYKQYWNVDSHYKQMWKYSKDSCCSNNENGLANCKKQCTDHFESLKQSALRTKKAYEDELARQQNAINNYGNCKKTYDNAKSSSKPAYDAADGNRTTCRNGCDDTRDTCNGNCDGSYITCTNNCQAGDSSCTSQCSTTRSSCKNKCSTNRTSCHSGCQTAYNNARKPYQDAVSARNKCDDDYNYAVWYKKTYSGYPAMYQGYADDYQKKKDEAGIDQNYQYKWFYEKFNYTATNSTVCCKAESGMDYCWFERKYQNQMPFKCSYQDYTSNNAMYNYLHNSCQPGLRPTMYSECTNRKTRFSNSIKSYKQERDWGYNNQGNDSDFDERYGTKANCRTKPTADKYKGWTEKPGDTGDPRILIRDNTGLAYRCSKRAALPGTNNMNDDQLKSHYEFYKDKLSLQGYINAYIEPQIKVIEGRRNNYAKSQSNNFYKDFWRRETLRSGGNRWLCSNRLYTQDDDWRSIATNECIAVNLLNGCLKQANNIIKNYKGTDLTHKSEGVMMAQYESHWCQDGYSLNASRCYKYLCYPVPAGIQGEYCRRHDPFYVEANEQCEIGNTTGELVMVETPNGTITCRNCAIPDSCARALQIGYRYDTMATNPYNNTIPGYRIDDKNSARYRTVRGTCFTPVKDKCVHLYYKNQNHYIGLCDVDDGREFTCANYNLYDSASCLTAPNKTPVVQYIYKYKTNGDIEDKKKCYTGDCANTCTVNGYFSSYTEAGCTNLNSCVDGSATCPEGRKIKNYVTTINGVTCYTAHCRTSPPVYPAPSTDQCVLHGFKPQGYTCNPNKEVSLGTKRITYYDASGSERKLDCLIGCKLKQNYPETCESQGKDTNANSMEAGIMIYRNNKEQQYTTLSSYYFLRGERRWNYTDFIGHTHTHIVAGSNGTFTDGSTSDRSVCRFDQCVPNDAAVAVEDLRKIFNESPCRGMSSTSVGGSFSPYYIVERGALYDSCDHIYTYNRCVAKTNSCAPSCRMDTDMGYGTYETDCQYYGDTKMVDEDKCTDKTPGATQTKYYSLIACNPPTCDNGGTLSIKSNTNLKLGDTEGHTNAAKCGETYDLDCNHRILIKNRSGGNSYINNACFGRGGTYQCQYFPPVPDNISSNCHIGNTTCYQLNGCNVEYGNDGHTKTSTHPTEFGQPNENNLEVCHHDESACGEYDLNCIYNARRCNANDDYIFIPAGRSDTWEAMKANYGTANVNYKAGNNGLRCGRYMHVSKPRWTISTNDTDPKAGNNAYIAGGTDATVTMMAANRCQGTINPLDSGSFEVKGDLELDYNYFKTLVDINQLPTCADISSWNATTFTDNTANMDGYYVCKYTTANVNSEDMLNKGLLDPSRNVIVFFNASNSVLRINTNIVTDLDHFKAFIVNGKIQIDGNVGKFPKAAYADNYGCSSATGADIQAFLGAEEIIFEHNYNDGLGSKSRVAGYAAELLPFNDLSELYCDRQLVIAGNLVQWGNKPLNMNRTFKGCVGGNATTEGESEADWNAVLANPAIYPDYNAFMSPVVLYQRADFISAAPNWMKTTNVERIETN